MKTLSRNHVLFSNTLELSKPSSSSSTSSSKRNHCMISSSSRCSLQFVTPQPVTTWCLKCQLLRRSF